MASLAAVATTHQNDNHNQTSTCSELSEYSCCRSCWNRKSCNKRRNIEQQEKMSNHHQQLRHRRTSFLYETVSINQNHEPYFAKSKHHQQPKPHLITNYLLPAVLQQTSVSSSGHCQVLSLVAATAATATPSSSPPSSLMSKALINIHRHTSYLCQILELLRGATTTTTNNNNATTTHSSATDQQQLATTESATTNHSSARLSSNTSGTAAFIESILADSRVNEPVNYSSMMMEQAEDICIASECSSGNESPAAALYLDDDDDNSLSSCNQCVQSYHTTAFPSGLDDDDSSNSRLQLPYSRIRSSVDSRHPVASTTSPVVSTPSRHRIHRPSECWWSRLVPGHSSSSVLTSPLFLTLLLLCTFMLHTADSCSSRSTPKPRPPTPTTRPNITFQTLACPEAYAKWFCLNGATCFSVPIGDSILYNCECADGYMGQRCEFKDLDNSYGPGGRAEKIQTAGIAGGVTLAVLLVVVFSLTYYTYLRNHMRAKSPPLLGYSHHHHEEGDMDRDDRATVAESNYQHNIRQHYQYSTFSNCGKQSNCSSSNTQLPQAISAKYATYGAAAAALIPPASARINYDPRHQSPPVTTVTATSPTTTPLQCVACMSKLHHHYQQQQIKVAANQNSILDLEHGIAHHHHHPQQQQNPFVHISSPTSFC